LAALGFSELGQEAAKKSVTVTSAEPEAVQIKHPIERG
jgi:hypothetical protein